jgi:hypothetical protein
LDFVGFPFRNSKLKNDISYIKYKFSHRSGKVCRWLNMYYSNIRIIIFKKLTTMSIWIILKNLVWTYKECTFCHYWATILCIHPHVNNHHKCLKPKDFLHSHSFTNVFKIQAMRCQKKANDQRFFTQWKAT